MLRRKQAINALGAIATAIVFVIVLVTKFAAGRLDRRRRRADPVRCDEGDRAPLRRRSASSSRPRRPGVALPGRIHAVVLVSNLLAPTLRALAFAQATSPATLRAVHVAADDEPTTAGRRVARARGAGTARRDRVARTVRRSGPCFDTCASFEASILGT